MSAAVSRCCCCSLVESRSLDPGQRVVDHSTAARILRHSAATPRTCSSADTSDDQHRHPGGCTAISIVVFAAGNCGDVLFRASAAAPRSRAGHSVWGANAHPLVSHPSARCGPTRRGSATPTPWTRPSRRLGETEADLCAPQAMFWREQTIARLLDIGKFAAMRDDRGRSRRAAAAIRHGIQFAVTPAAMRRR